MLQQAEQQLRACSEAPVAVEPLPAGIRRLQVYLIKPSKYDDDGYVIRYFRGVLPSNTLSTLYSLTEDQHLSGALGEGLEVRTTVLDETVQRIPVQRIIRRAARQRDTRTVIALAGVQTNQFPRAHDLALQFRDGGLPVMIGGFHVSGCRTSRVAYLEGWFVVPEARRRGVGRALVSAAEEWGRTQGCTEFASDTQPDNQASDAAHRALGFSEAGLVLCFRKEL